jgi:hypothetical protein
MADKNVSSGTAGICQGTVAILTRFVLRLMPLISLSSLAAVEPWAQPLASTAGADYCTKVSRWFFRELLVGTGRHNNGAQRLDAFALNTLLHTAMRRVCYEVKLRGLTP